jgi:hypothetical protein
MRGNKKKYLENLYTSSFINRCYDYIINGKKSNFSKEEKRIWREFKKLTHTPVLFKNEVEKQNILSQALTNKEDPYCILKSLFIDIITYLEGKNKYAEKLSLILSEDSFKIENSLYCLLEIGALAREIIKNQVKTIYFSSEILEGFLDLYNQNYFCNSNLLTRCQAKDYYTIPYYFQFPDEFFMGIKDVHVFHRLIMTNNSVFDETHIFFRIKIGKNNNFVLATNNREKIDGLKRTLTQDCLIYDIGLKKRQQPLRPLIEKELNTIFNLAPIINKYLSYKEADSPTYKNGTAITGDLNDLKSIIKKSSSKYAISECFLFNNILTKTFFT